MICELAQIAYIAITAVILAKERSIKLVDKEQLKYKQLMERDESIMSRSSKYVTFWIIIR